MLHNLINLNPMLIVFITMTIYVVIGTLLIRSAKNHNRSMIYKYKHNHFVKSDDIEESNIMIKYDYEITSNMCPICNRYDVIHMTKFQLSECCKKSEIGVGEVRIIHNSKHVEHEVIHYINTKGEWVGDEISHEALTQAINEENISDITDEIHLVLDNDNE